MSKRPRSGRSGSSRGKLKPSPLDKALMATVEEFHADKFVSDATWSALAQHFDDGQLFELLVLIGQFASVAFVINSLRLRLEHSNRGFFA